MNELSTHPEKPKFMVIDFPRRQIKLPELPPFYLRIKQTHKTKYLGLTVDDKLFWDQQYKPVKRMVPDGLASIRKLKNTLPQSQLLNVYQALIESHLRYANMIWDALSNTKLSTLKNFQNRAFDIVEPSKEKVSWNKNLMNTNLLMAFDRVVMTYKIVNSLCTEDLQNKFIEGRHIKYNTRNKEDLHVQKVALEHTKRGCLYTGPVAWNNIPQPIRDAVYIVRFKKN